MADYFYGKTEEEAIQKGIDSPFPIDFVGQNCNDYLDDEESECLGWNGQDRRCYCGNRRVSWITEKQEDGQWLAYGEAY